MRSIAIFGDVNLDRTVQGNLPFRFSDMTENGIVSFGTVVELPGGTGLNFALAAKSQGIEPFLLASLGEDLTGKALAWFLQEQGVDSVLQFHPGIATGQAFIARDQADIRFLHDNSPNANRFLDWHWIETHLSRILACDLVYVSGYCLRNEESPRHQAMLRLLAWLKTERGPRLVWDVVPHRIHEEYPIEEYLQAIAGAEVVVSDVQTIRRFLKLGHPGQIIDEAIATETAKLAMELFPRTILRWGPSGLDHEIRTAQGVSQVVHHHHGKLGTSQKRGYGDVLALQALRAWGF